MNSFYFGTKKPTDPVKIKILEVICEDDFYECNHMTKFLSGVTNWTTVTFKEFLEIKDWLYMRKPSKDDEGRLIKYIVLRDTDVNPQLCLDEIRKTKAAEEEKERKRQEKLKKQAAERVKRKQINLAKKKADRKKQFEALKKEFEEDGEG